jgi:hypothetical protein
MNVLKNGKNNMILYDRAITQKVRQIFKVIISKGEKYHLQHRE